MTDLEETRTRIVLTFLAAVAVLGLLTVRLFQIQVPSEGLPFSNPHLKTITLHRRRGSILDRNGNRLAFSVPAMGVVVDTRKVEDPEGAAADLGPLLGILPEELLPKLRSGRAYQVLAHKVDPEVADHIRKLRIPGLTFEQEYRRFYPNGSMAAPLLGFVGGDGKGREGLEYHFDETLTAEPGHKRVLTGLPGFPLPGGVLEREAPQGGADLQLTIDEIIQHLAERELDEIQRLYQPKSAFLLVMDPNTGEILAWASRPSFDPNAYQAYPNWSWRNRMVTDFYEPGSTFKIITAAAALEDRVLDLETTFHCPGYVKLWGHAIGCHGRHGDVTLPDIIARSCNAGIIQVGQVLGPKNLYYYIRKFGFGEPTGLPHAAETGGILRYPEKWSGLSIGAISMGQEVAVTAVQMASAISVIANGGYLVKPRIVKDVESQEGKSLDERPEVEVRHRVISPETSEVVTRMMNEVIVRGTGRRGKLDVWAAAGKTGTSQKLGLRSRFRDGEKFVASFVGFLPVRAPKAVIYIVINEPKGKRTEIDGGLIAAPAFRRLAPKIMIYRDVPPDEALSKALVRQVASPGEAGDPPLFSSAPLGGAPEDPAGPEASQELVIDVGRFRNVEDMSGLPAAAAIPVPPNGGERRDAPLEDAPPPAPAGRVSPDVLYVGEDPIQSILESHTPAGTPTPTRAPAEAGLSGELPPPR